MCQPQSEGGQRCAAHTRAALTKAEAKFQRTNSTEDFYAQENARAEFAATPTGQQEIQERLATLNPASPLAVDLTEALRRGAWIRERNQAVRAASAPAPSGADPNESGAQQEAATEAAAAATPAPAPASAVETNRYGFPLRTCRRCGGSGRYSYNAMDGDTCYGCSGSGKQLATKQASEAWGKFVTACRKAKRPITGDLEAGDEVTWDWNNGATKPAADATWRTVARIETTDQTCGSYTEGVGENAVTTHWYYQMVTYTDGTTERHSQNSVCCRRGKTVDPAPYVAEATAPRPRRSRARTAATA